MDQTLKLILKKFGLTVDENGIVHGNPEFDGQPVWAPLFWVLGYTDGVADEVRSGEYIFNIGAWERKTFKDIPEEADYIGIKFDTYGFTDSRCF